jgi:hypothetical protein
LRFGHVSCDLGHGAGGVDGQAYPVQPMHCPAENEVVDLTVSEDAPALHKQWLRTVFMLKIPNTLSQGDP